MGAKTASSKWVNWEIDRAKQSDIKLKLAAVKIDRGYTTPAGLLEAGTSWAYSFEQDSIIAALNAASNSY